MAEFPAPAELSLREGYLTPRDLPQGECILTSLYDVGAEISVRIDHADPRILISAELLAQIAAAPHPFAALTGGRGPDDAPFWLGAVLRIDAANRTVIYRIVEYVPAIHGYIAEWPD